MASDRTNSGPTQEPQLGYPLDTFASGFDKKFLCGSCHLILRDPVQSFCGHRFCQNCIKAIIEHGDDTQCASCIEEGVADGEFSLIRVDQQFPDNAVKRDMSRMEARCANSGCSWTGIFKNFESHAESCQYKLVACPNHCNTTVTVGNLEHHIQNECLLQMIECKFCKEQIKAGQREEHVNTVCLKFRIKCDMCGKKRILREKFEEHKQECRALRYSCPVCNVNDMDKDALVKHVTQNTPSHLIWCLKQMSEIEGVMRNNIGHYLSEFESNIHQTIQEKIQKSTNNGPRNLSSNNNENHINETSSPISQITGAVASVTEDDLQRINCVPALEIKIGTFESIVGVLHREIERCLTAIDALDRRQKMDQEIIMSYENNLKSLERSLIQKDAALAEMAEKLNNMEQATFDGKLLWKIPNFSRARKEALDGRTPSIYSPPFYTSKCGYKMCGRLYPNGDGMGKGKFISLFFVVMKNHYDALLPWPFQQKVTLLMIDQKNEHHHMDTFMPDPHSSSFRKPTSDMNIASGCPKFIPLSALDDSSKGYVLDDTMFIRIIVDTAGLDERIIGWDDRK